MEEALAKVWRLPEYDVVVLADADDATITAVDAFCRKRGIKLIAANVRGVWARLFNDFGDKFEVIDKNGDAPVEVVLSEITREERAVVKLLKGARHPFEDGEQIVIRGVEEVASEGATSSLNDSVHTVSVINQNSFYIGDTRHCARYVRNGTARNIKVPLQLAFSDFATMRAKPHFDAILAQHDFEKFERHLSLHEFFTALDIYAHQKRTLPTLYDESHAQAFVELVTELRGTPLEEAQKQLARRFSHTVEGAFAPLAAFMGGFVAQELVKAITQKYVPVQQLFYTDCAEVLPEEQELLSVGGSEITPPTTTVL